MKETNDSSAMQKETDVQSMAERADNIADVLVSTDAQADQEPREQDASAAGEHAESETCSPHHSTGNTESTEHSEHHKHHVHHEEHHVHHDHHSHHSESHHHHHKEPSDFELSRRRKKNLKLLSKALFYILSVIAAIILLFVIYIYF
jgi:cation transport ATPase